MKQSLRMRQDMSRSLTGMTCLFLVVVLLDKTVIFFCVFI